MTSRATGWRLSVFLAAVAVVLAWGLGRQVVRKGYREALAQVLDGDLDREERLAALAVLRDSLKPDVPDRTLVAAMAAVMLNDRRAFEAAADQLTPLLVDSVSGEGRRQAALGEPCLRSLLAALSAESRGDLEEAAALYAQVELSAQLWKVPLAKELAAAGLLRLH